MYILYLCTLTHVVSSCCRSISFSSDVIAIQVFEQQREVQQVHTTPTNSCNTLLIFLIRLVAVLKKEQGTEDGTKQGRLVFQVPLHIWQAMTITAMSALRNWLFVSSQMLIIIKYVNLKLSLSLKWKNK